MSLIRRILPFLLVLLTAAAATAGELPELTLAPRNGTLRIAVTGDTGKGTEAVAKGIAVLHAAKPFDAIVLAGDNFYPCGVTSVDDARWSLAVPLTRIGVPVFPVLGNHDFCGSAGALPQIQANGRIANWRFPATQYVVRAGVADFAFVNTTPLAKGGLNAVEPAIRTAFADTKAPWRVIVGHHPVISSGYHGYFPRSEVKRMRTLIPALRATHADLWIGGHDHHMELIRGRMLHLTSGAGSSPIPPIKLRRSTVYPTEIRRERIGFAVVEITAQELRIRFYDGNGKAKSEWLRQSRPK